MALQVKDGETFWKPSWKQEQFIRIPFNVLEGFFGGAAGPGKSELILLLPVIYQFTNNSHFYGMIFRRTLPELKKSLIPRSREYFSQMGATFNETEAVWKFPSGAKLGFSYCDIYKDVFKHQSAEYQYLGFDELTHFQEDMYTYLLSRLRSVGSDLPKLARSASNPGNIGHAWVRKRFIQPCKEGGKLIYHSKSKTYRIFISATATDNPYLQRDDPGYYDRLKLLPPAEQKALIDGDWWAFAGQVFTEFRANRHPDEPEHAYHVIKPFVIPTWWPKIVGGDWGHRAKTWIGWAAINPFRQIILYREYVCQKKSIKSWGSDIRRLGQWDGNIKEPAYMDPSAWKDEGHEFNIAEQIMAATEMQWVKANNDRLAGKLLIHELLRWEPKPKSFLPQSDYNHDLYLRINRMNGSEAAASYLRMFEEEAPETHLPRLLIFENCTEFIEALQTAVYRDETTGKKAEDVAEWDGDDPYDGGRYLLMGADAYCEEAAHEHKEREDLAAIINRYKGEADQTGFYRAMEQYEQDHHIGGEYVSERMKRHVGLAQRFN